MSPKTVHRTLIAAMLGTACIAPVAQGGQKTETAYDNFPEVPSGWYATGCCSGAIIADDIQTAPGTELKSQVS